MKFLLAALALGAPMAAPATAPVTVPSGDLDRLVVLLMPDQALLDLVMASVRNESKKHPEFARDPAMTDYVIVRIRPEIGRLMREALPELRSEMATIIAAEMTADEIAEVYAFFSSPTGQKLQRYAFEAIAENPTTPPAEQKRIAVERFMADLAPADYPALSAFGTSAAARKMPQVTPKVSAASAAWADRLVAKHGPRFAEMRTQAVADYKRQKGAGQ
jgi:hypothetical protein